MDRRELDLTEADILTLLQQARDKPILPSDPPGARTVEDLSNELGLSDRTIRRMIRRLKQDGVELEVVRVTRLNILDKPYTTYAFRMPDAED